MANRYGEAALMATRCTSFGDVNPVARWETAMENLYPTSPAARTKSCPRSMRRGMVKGIPAGHYTASKDNKAYAVRAAALLSEGTRSWSTSALWQAVSNDPEKTHNSQMDIVLALWKNDLIVGNS